MFSYGLLVRLCWGELKYANILAKGVTGSELWRLQVRKKTESPVFLVLQLVMNGMWCCSGDQWGIHSLGAGSDAVSSNHLWKYHYISHMVPNLLLPQYRKRWHRQSADSLLIRRSKYVISTSFSHVFFSYQWTKVASFSICIVESEEPEFKAASKKHVRYSLNLDMNDDSRRFRRHTNDV